MEFEKLEFFYARNDSPRPSDYNRHCHDGYEIIYVLEGRGRYVVEGTEYELCPNTLMIFRPNEFHYVDILPDHPYSRYVINFDKSFLESDSEYLVRHFNEKPLGVGNFYSAMDIPLSVHSIFERLDNIATLPAAEQKIMAKMLVGELLVLLSVSSPKERTSGAEPLGAKVIRYLNENIATPISLDELAKRFYVSKFYLCRAFKSYNGISIVGYINSKRVMLAREMIESGETASNASLKVGFGDYSSFYRACKKVTGESPKKTNNEVLSSLGAGRD